LPDPQRRKSDLQQLCELKTRQLKQKTLKEISDCQTYKERDSQQFIFKTR
jgi:hypothetical protein